MTGMYIYLMTPTEGGHPSIASAIASSASTTSIASSNKKVALKYAREYYADNDYCFPVTALDFNKALDDDGIITTSVLTIEKHYVYRR
jgi:hypothetical protein